MTFKKEYLPYYVCGGYPEKESWIFFTPKGQITIANCNAALELLLPLCNGNNSFSYILEELRKSFDRNSIEELFAALSESLIIVDANEIFKVFYQYSKNPMPFQVDITRDVSDSFTVSEEHVPTIQGHTVSGKIPRRGIQRLMDIRRTTRNFSGSRMTEDEIFSLVWSMYGTQEKRERSHEDSFMKRTYTVPSGGALYPLLIYVFIFRETGRIKKGVYLWYKERSLLELISPGDLRAQVESAVNGLDDLANATGLISVVANFERSAFKYGNKSYNLIQQEVGHVMQNANLFCAERSIGIVEVGGYEDEKIANLLRLDFQNKAPLITAVFGKI